MSDKEKTCPQCAEQVKVAAKICKHCGHTFTAAENAAAVQGSPDASNTVIGCGLLIGLALLIGMCSGNDDDGSAPERALADVDARIEASGANSSAASASDGATGSESAWYYFETKDELRGGTTYFARVTSDNKVDFDFPYNGGSRLTMTIRKSPQYGTDVYFEISKGQYTCGLYNCKGAISFDGASEGLTLTTPDDHSSDILFATYGEAIIRKLKQSDRTIVELPFFQEGNRQFTFDTSELEWPPK